MTAAPFRWWNIRIDDTKYGIRIDSSWPIPIDHTAFTAIVNTRPAGGQRLMAVSGGNARIAARAAGGARLKVTHPKC